MRNFNSTESQDFWEELRAGHLAIKFLREYFRRLQEQD